jgi:cytoskeletal protein CcmA (bactofilin family)
MMKSRHSKPVPQVGTLIGPQVTIRGDVRFSGSLHVEGHIIGDVVADPNQQATLSLAEQGRIEGQVRAPIVLVDGELIGDVFGDQRVQLNGKARVRGDVHYKVVEMSAGAQLTGRLIWADAIAADAACVDDSEIPCLEVGLPN